MKTFILISALALTSAGSAFAMTSGELPAHLRAEVQRLVPEADLSNLSKSQSGAIQNIFVSSDNFTAGNAPSGQIRAILNWN